MTKGNSTPEYFPNPCRISHEWFAWGIVLVWLLFLPKSVTAFNLSPEGTALERRLSQVGESWLKRIIESWALRGIHHFTEPVHEEITQRIYGCEGDEAVCADPDLGFASSFIVAGVRWNDDPPFRLGKGQGRGLDCKVEETIRFITQPVCWAGLWRDGKARAERGEFFDEASGVSLLYRSHFGDLQFLHSMASRDGETAETTRKKILMWAEFSWRTALKEYTLQTYLRDIPIEGFNDHFARSGWRVQDLFTLGNYQLRKNMHEVAFGSLLHMVEDSFARGHVDREEPVYGQTCSETDQYPKPGMIREFHSYGNQDASKHAEYDSRHKFTMYMSAERPNVVDVGRVLKDLYARGNSWEAIKPYFECVFQIEDSAKASPGTAFEK